MHVSLEVLEGVVDIVVDQLVGIDDLYPVQMELLQSLLNERNIFFTSATNSGKTLPAVMYPYVLDELCKIGYEAPQGKVLFVTALNSIKLSMVSSVKALGMACEAVTADNYIDVISSPEIKVLFVSPEVLKIPRVTSCLLSNRQAFILKVIDECHLGEKSNTYKDQNSKLISRGFLIKNWVLSSPLKSQPIFGIHWGVTILKCLVLMGF